MAPGAKYLWFRNHLRNVRETEKLWLSGKWHHSSRSVNSDIQIFLFAWSHPNCLTKHLSWPVSLCLMMSKELSENALELLFRIVLCFLQRKCWDSAFFVVFGYKIKIRTEQVGDLCGILWKETLDHYWILEFMIEYEQNHTVAELNIPDIYVYHLGISNF